MECDRHVIEGVFALRNFHIDQLPPSVKGAALRAINRASTAADQITNSIDSLLRAYARSPLIDPDAEQASNADDAKERSEKLKLLQVLYPGNWRAPRATRKKGARRTEGLR